MVIKKSKRLKMAEDEWEKVLFAGLKSVFCI